VRHSTDFESQHAMNYSFVITIVINNNFKEQLYFLLNFIKDKDMNKRFSNPYVATLVFILFSSISLSQNIKVTLLGTGAPVPSIERFGPSTLLEAGGQRFLFDCGRGAAQRLWQLKIPLGQVNMMFLTHLHSDHVVGIPDVWLTGWIPAIYGRRDSPLQVWGPAGTKEMMEYLQKAFAWDIRTRSKEKNKADSGIIIKALDISQGVVFDKGGVKITAFLVNHADFIDSALGYRIDYGGHSVLISGDTRYCENLIKFAKGADVIIHEVSAANKESMQNSTLVKQILGFHISPEDAGRVFEQVKPKLAVYTHIVLLTATPSIPPPTLNDLAQQTRTTYTGALQIGEDLMSIEIGDQVKVSKYTPPINKPTEIIK
jgi:ribonuclease Z